MKVNKLFNHIHHKILGIDLINTAQKTDPNANGVQIWGSKNIKKIAIGVSCNQEFLNKAVRWGADVCIFHHGLSLSNWGIINSRMSNFLQNQIKIIVKNDLTIAGYHYALDVHSIIGNNAQIIQKLNMKNTKEKYYQIQNDFWGLIGEYDEPKFVQEIAHEASKLFKHDVFMVLANDKQKIKRVGISSGNSRIKAQHLEEIKLKNIDLHITGEISENNPAMTKESGFSYFACGHYATETLGIKALGKEIKKSFPQLEIKFIDIWNEV